MCSSQSNKAFELAAAYLQITKERRKQIIINKTKLLHRFYEGSMEILLTEKSENKNKYLCKVKLSWKYWAMTDIWEDDYGTSF